LINDVDLTNASDSRPPGVNPSPDIEGATFYNVIAELPGVGANLFLENDPSSAEFLDLIINLFNNKLIKKRSILLTASCLLK
jgi:hypothetical protein